MVLLCQDVAWLSHTVVTEDGEEFKVPQGLRLQLRVDLARQYQEFHKKGDPMWLSRATLYVLFDFLAAKDIKAGAALDKNVVEGRLFLVCLLFLRSIFTFQQV
jgi:hypothetical protein